MAVSNEDVAEAQQRVARLREQVAQEAAKREAREADLANEVTLAQLAREEKILEAELATLKNNAQGVKELRESGPIASINEQVKVAAAAAKAAEKGVAPALVQPTTDAADNNEKQEG